MKTKLKPFVPFSILFIFFCFIYFEFFLQIFTKTFLGYNELIVLYSLIFSILFTLGLILINNSKFQKILIYSILSISSIIYLTELFLKRSFGFYYPPEIILGMSNSVISSYSGTLLSIIKKGVFIILIYNSKLFCKLSVF